MVFHGVPELICQGSPRAIGLAHGKGATQQIRNSIALYTTLFGETAGIDWPEARRRAQAFVPSIQYHAPHLYEEMQGIADGAGAGVDVDDILTLNVRSEIALTNYSDSDGCTSLAGVDPAGTDHVFLAQNWDWVEEAADSLVLVDLRADGKPRALLMCEAGIVGKFGLNTHGFGVCMNAIRCGAQDASRLPVHIALRLAIECPSFAAAKAMLDAKGLASTCNIVMADRGGAFGSVECSPRGNTVIRAAPGETIVCHTNHLYAPDGAPGLVDHPAANSFARLARIRQLTRGRAPQSMQQVRAWLSDEHGLPAAICRQRPPNATGTERMVTLATIIMDLTALELEVSFGRPSLSPPVKQMAF